MKNTDAGLWLPLFLPCPAGRHLKCCHLFVLEQILQREIYVCDPCSWQDGSDWLDPAGMCHMHAVPLTPSQLVT